MTVQPQAEGLLETPVSRAQWEVEDVADPRHPNTIALIDYYNELPRTGGVPSRADIDMLKILDLVDGVYMAERDAEGEWRYRFVGSGIENRMHRTATGRSLSDLFTPDGVARMRMRYDAAAIGHSMILVRGHVRGVGLDHIPYESVLMPLRARDGGGIMVFGGLYAFDMPPVRRPAIVPR